MKFVHRLKASLLPMCMYGCGGEECCKREDRTENKGVAAVV